MGNQDSDPFSKYDYGDPTQPATEHSDNLPVVKLNAEELELAATFMVAAWFERHDPERSQFLIDANLELKKHNRPDWYVITYHLVVDGIPETHVFHANPTTREINRVSTS